MRVLLLGGNRYNLRCIEAVGRAGVETVVADRNPEAPGLTAAAIPLPVDIRDEDALFEAVRGLGGVDGVVSMAEVGVPTAARLSRRLGTPGISPEAADRATSKAAMRCCWERDLSVGFRVVESEEEARRAVARLGGPPVVFKPDRSLGGSRGVSRVESEAQVAEAWRFAAEEGGAVVVEEALEGDEFSAEVLIWQGRTSVLCFGRKVKSRHPYRVDVSVQYPGPADRPAVEEMCRLAVEGLGMTQGVAHVEFAWTSRGPLPFELGARCGGGHTPLIARHVSGVDEFLEACHMACGVAPAMDPTRELGADYRFLVLPPGRLAELVIPDEVRDDPAILDVAFTSVPGDLLEDYRTARDRAGFLVALGSDREDAVAAADRACTRLRAVYSDGRVAHPLALGHFVGASS